MAYTLNTSHPLYGNIIELIGVQSGALVSHKTARTFTKHADASFVTGGTYGEAFRFFGGGYTHKGATFSPAISFSTHDKPNVTLFLVLNSVSDLNTAGTARPIFSGYPTPTIGYSDTGVKALSGPSDDVATYETEISNGTAKTLAVTRSGESSHELFVNKVSVGTGGKLGWNNATATYTNIGGVEGQTSAAGDFVWAVVFDKVLSSAEIASLHDSLGANNAFGLVESAGGGNATPTFPGPNIGNQTGTVGTPISFSVASKFSDTDALTFSAVGSWPPGVTVSSAGVISGTPTTAGTYATLKVRATDTAAQTVDSDTFSFTLSASAHLITVASSQQVNTASAAAIQQSGNGIITLPTLKDWGTGNVKANETGITLIINNATTGALVSLLTGQTTNASAALPTLTGLVSGTAYRITTILADGSEGTWKYTAA